MSISPYSAFVTELQVRPDDIDMNQHVHNSRYFDYVLAARYEQMERCYKMSMEEFIKLGYGWVIDTAYVEYKRPLGLGDFFNVETQVEDMQAKGAKVRFEITKKLTGKVCCKGWFNYTMVNINTGRSVVVPDWIVEKYRV